MSSDTLDTTRPVESPDTSHIALQSPYTHDSRQSGQSTPQPPPNITQTQITQYEREAELLTESPAMLTLRWKAWQREAEFNAEELAAMTQDRDDWERRAFAAAEERDKAPTAQQDLLIAKLRATVEHWKRQHDRIASIVQGWADYGNAWRKEFKAVTHENNMLRKRNERLKATENQLNAMTADRNGYAKHARFLSEVAQRVRDLTNEEIHALEVPTEESAAFLVAVEGAKAEMPKGGATQ